MASSFSPEKARVPPATELPLPPISKVALLVIWLLFAAYTPADYGGLTKSFCHGKIYCTLITAKPVNFKIGIPWEKNEILPLNQKITIAGVDVTCFDANHCPSAIVILFEPPNGNAILHTGDFHFSEDMTKISSLQTRVHTLVLDTTYCNPQYDFPRQEAVIQYVLEAIQADAFNPRTLFLIGSYTIGAFFDMYIGCPSLRANKNRYRRKCRQYNEKVLIMQPASLYSILNRQLIHNQSVVVGRVFKREDKEIGKYTHFQERKCNLDSIACSWKI